MNRLAPFAGAVVAACLTMTACSSPEPAEPPAPAPATSKAPKPTPTPKADPLAGLDQFEKDNNVPSSDWYGHVTEKRAQGQTALWISTDLPATDTDTGNRICGTYALYSADSTIRNVLVRAADGNSLAKCGPGF